MFQYLVAYNNNIHFTPHFFIEIKSLQLRHSRLCEEFHRQQVKVMEEMGKVEWKGRKEEAMKKKATPESK